MSLSKLERDDVEIEARQRAKRLADKFREEYYEGREQPFKPEPILTPSMMQVLNQIMEQFNAPQSG